MNMLVWPWQCMGIKMRMKTTSEPQQVYSRATSSS